MVTHKGQFSAWFRVSEPVIREIVDGFTKSITKISRENVDLQSYALKGFQKHTGQPCICLPKGVDVRTNDMVEWDFGQGYVNQEIWKVIDTNRFQWGTLVFVDKFGLPKKDLLMRGPEYSDAKHEGIEMNSEITLKPDDWVEIRGSWEISKDIIVHTGEILENPDGSLDDRLLIYPVDILEGEISAEMRMMDSVDNTSAWVVFGYQDANHFFSAGIGGYRNKFAVNVREGLGSQRLDGQGYEKELKLKEWYPISVSFSAAGFELNVRGVSILRASHPSYKTGKVGLKVFGPVCAEFRNIRIHKSLSVKEFPLTNLHSTILDASGRLFEDGHYAQAIFEAVKSLENMIKEKTGLELGGRNLMRRVFKSGSPKIELNRGTSQSEKDEREGFALIYEGVIPGIRNPKAHDSIIQSDPKRAFEYLAFMSLLARRVDEGRLAEEAGDK